MKFKKPPAELIACFVAELPDEPGLERRQMFGYDAAFLRGNFLAGMWEDGVVVKLDEARVEALVAAGEARRFAPMKGRVMTGWALLPEAAVRDAGTLRARLAEAVAFVGRLPPKRKAVAAKKASKEKKSKKA